VSDATPRIESSSGKRRTPVLSTEVARLSGKQYPCFPANCQDFSGGRRVSQIDRHTRRIAGGPFRSIEPFLAWQNLSYPPSEIAFRLTTAGGEGGLCRCFPGRSGEDRACGPCLLCMKRTDYYARSRHIAAQATQPDELVFRIKTKNRESSELRSLFILASPRACLALAERMVPTPGPVRRKSIHPRQCRSPSEAQSTHV
jgi:hypothetical protein